jgi:hypothetical protein
MEHAGRISMSAIGQANAFLGNLAKIGFVVIGGVAAFLGWKLVDLGTRSQAELAQKVAEVKRLESDNERLALALKLMKVDRRIARLIVIDQTGTAGALRTKVRFQEVDARGEPLGDAVEATLDGEVVYVDAWVVKFDDALVERGDPLRGASLVLFRRLFGERQAPTAGITLDRDGVRPKAYGGDAPFDEVEREVWAKFWEFADDPKAAARLGVRLAQGEAPSRKVKKGEVYQLTVRASGGLDFALDRPAAGGQ